MPDTPGVRFHNMVTVSLGGVGTINRVINNTGGPANSATQTVVPRQLPVSRPKEERTIGMTSHLKRGGRAMLLGAATLMIVLSGGATANATGGARVPDLGPNVIVFDPAMPVSEIQAQVDAIHAQQVDNEMGTNRYALLFKPGTYGTDAEPLQMKVGYYTEVAGLGAVADRRRRQRQDRGLQPLPGERRHEQLPRAGELLAHAVQPHAEGQRRRPGRLPLVGELLGRVAGRVDAAVSTSPAGPCR